MHAGIKLVLKLLQVAICILSWRMQVVHKKLGERSVVVGVDVCGVRHADILREHHHLLAAARDKS